MRLDEATEDRLRTLAEQVQVADRALGGQWVTVEELTDAGDTELDRLLNRWLAALSPTVVLGLLDELVCARTALPPQVETPLIEEAAGETVTAPEPEPEPEQQPPSPASGRCACGDARRDHKTQFHFGQAVGGPCKLCGCHRWDPADG